MAFTQKIKKKFSVTKYTTGTIEYNSLFQIASAMGGDPRYLSSDPGFTGVPIEKHTIKSCFRNLIHENKNHIFSRASWDKWLWQMGHVEKRNQIEALQTNLIHNRLVVKLTGSVDSETGRDTVQSRYQVSKIVQKASSINHNKETAEPILNLDNGDYTVYSFPSRTDTKDFQIIPSSNAMLLNNIDRALILTKTVTKPTKAKAKTKYKAKTKINTNQEDTKLLFFMRRETMESRRHNPDLNH